MIETLGSLAKASGHDLSELRFDDAIQLAGNAPGASLENPRTPLSAIFNVEPSYTGRSVTPANSMNLAPVWRCVSLIAGAIARTPFYPYLQKENGDELAKTHYLWPVMTQSANQRMTSYRFRRVMQTWLCLWGNAYAEIVMNNRNQITDLIPWRPDRVSLSGTLDTLAYTYTMNSGARVTLAADYVLHLRGLELDGLMGLSPIASARQAVGLAAAADEYGARFFGNNARMGGILEHPGKLSNPARDNLRASIEDVHRGLTGAHRLGILEEGMKYHEVGVPPEDVQFLQTRNFQAIDIARLFGVPPHMIGELSRATFSNIEHQQIEFVNYCLDDWFENWRQECEHSFFSERERQQLVLKFYKRRLTQGDLKSRSEAYAIGRTNGWWSANDIREFEDENPIEGGDTYMQPLNMTDTTTDDPEPTDGEDPDQSGGTVEETPEPAPSPAPAATPKAAKRKAERKNARTQRRRNAPETSA